MHETILACVSALEFREAQQFENMTVLPLFAKTSEGPSYLTLGEAIGANLLTVKEVDSGGSVPELCAVNGSDRPVLLLDGEELIGAKQNRVVNTTILLKERSETAIPVSCTEQGRWSYRSEKFHDSDVVASHSVRSLKMASVNSSLGRGERFHSDQGGVWSKIREMSAEAGVDSDTGAMKDVYESKAHDLSEYVTAFPKLPGQRGLLVFTNGRIVGFDFVSYEAAYQKLHAKLAKSYAMDALIGRNPNLDMPDLAGAKTFIEAIGKTTETVYDSIGYGRDHRFDGGSAVGSALVHEDAVIHMAFFKTDTRDDGTRLSRSRHRMRYRG